MAGRSLRAMWCKVVAAGVAAIVVAGLSAGGAQAQVIRPQFWGLHAHDWGVMPTIPVGAANLASTGLTWRAIQTSESDFDWSRLDAQVEAAESHGVRPMLVLGSTPRFLSSRPGADDYYAYMPAQMGAWRAYVSAVAHRYGTRLDYQVWQEPNIVQNWQETPRDMARLTMVASRAIARATKGRAVVVAPSLPVRLWSQRKWMATYFKQSVGGKRVQAYVDAVAINPYPTLRGGPEESFQLMTSVRQQLAAIGVRKPLWTTEINYGVVGAHLGTVVHYSTAKQQAYVIRTFALSAAAKMQRTMWFGWFDFFEVAVNMTDPAGQVLAPGRSYEVVHGWLNGTDFRGCSVGKNGVWACVARAHHETRRIYWKVRGRAVLAVPRAVRRVEDQNGERVSGRKVAVTYRPVMVASRR